MTLHTFAVYVEDQPGVLNRVSSLFRRRGFNIHSLSVGSSETAGISRMTVVVQTDAGGAARIKAHLRKLVPVIRVDDLQPRAAVVRDLALIKVSATKVDGLVEVLRPYGVLEMVRTGRVAIDRGSVAEIARAAAVDPAAQATDSGVSFSV